MKLSLMLALVPRLCLGILSSPTFYLLPTSAKPSSEVWATTEKPIFFPNHRLKEEKEPDFSSTGRPSRRESGGSRDGCPEVAKKLTALVPITKSEAGTEYSLIKTTVEYPTFWFYTPYQLSSQHPVEFILLDDREHQIYTTKKLIVPSTLPGVISIHPTSVPLEIGKNYEWYFYVYCNPENPSDHVVVNGSVKRIALNSQQKNQLNAANIQEKVALYRQADIWYEALTIVGEQLRVNPQDGAIKTEWAKLLTEIQLGAIATEPLQQELKLKK